MNPYIVLVIQLFLSGLNYIIANAATQSIPPANLTFLRTIISGVVYLSYFFYAGLPFKFRGRDLRLLLFLSFISVSFNQFGFLYGMKYTTATEAAILYTLTPVFIMFLSRTYLSEKITAPKILGAIMALGGATFTVLSRVTPAQGDMHFGFDHFKGDIFILIAVMAWGTYTTLGRKLIVKHGAINSTVFTALIGTAMFAPVGIYSSVGYNYFSLSGGLWAEVLFLSLGTSVAGYVLWYYALGKIEASKVAVFINGQPVITAILAYIFLGQGITAMFAAGAIVTIAGVIITQVDSRKKVGQVSPAGRDAQKTI